MSMRICYAALGVAVALGAVAGSTSIAQADCQAVSVYSDGGAVEISGPTTICPEGAVPGDPGCDEVMDGACWPFSKKVIYTCPGGGKVYEFGDCALCVSEKSGTRKAGIDCCAAITEAGKAARQLCDHKVNRKADELSR